MSLDQHMHIYFRLTNSNLAGKVHCRYMTNVYKTAM